MQSDRTELSNAMASAAHTPGAVESQPASAPASATPTPCAVRSQLVPAPARATRSKPARAKKRGKRKREDLDATPGSPSAAEEGVDRKYDLDIDLLECPICSKRFSPPVYQCPRGHAVCSACCKKLANKKCPTCSLPTGSIRCMAIEKILESLLASCKYTPNGCKEMLKQTDIKRHEKERCKFKPFRCPFGECKFEGSSVTLPVHLTQEHRVRTVTHNSISGAGFRMDASDSVVMVKGDLETDLLFIVHRETHESPETGLGDVFFCTSLGPSDQSYDLKVKLCSHSALCYSMVGACAVNLADHWERSSFERDFLYLPIFRSGVKQIYTPAEIRFRLQVDSEEDDDEEEEEVD